VGDPGVKFVGVGEREGELDGVVDGEAGERDGLGVLENDNPVVGVGDTEGTVQEVSRVLAE